MFTIKSLLAMSAIAAGGFLNTGNGVPATTRAAPAPVASSLPIPAPHASSISDAVSLQRASESAVLAAVRKDLQDDRSGVRLSPLSFQRDGGRSIQGAGHGVVLFDGIGLLPIDVTVVYDLPGARIEQVNYRVTGKAERPKAELLGKKLRNAIADRIGARLVLEFSQQPVDFSLLEIEHLASGRNRVMITGNGVTNFIGEGAAYTRFVATADKFTGHILTVQYELLQEVPALDAASLATSS